MLLRQNLFKNLLFEETQAQNVIYGKTCYFRQKSDDFSKTDL